MQSSTDGPGLRSKGDPEQEEVALTGGGLTAEVVRIGDTVHRSAGPSTEAVHALLRHLEAKGFDGAPRALGFDDRGREILTYIEGAAGSEVDWLPELRTDAGLEAVVRLLGEFHHAVADFIPTERSEWLGGGPSPAPGEIICHNDPGPWNVVWREGRPVALIDWDFAGPRHPLDDVAYVAFYSIPMRDDAHCRRCGFAEIPDRAHRLRAICETYGNGATPDELIERAEHHLLGDIEELKEGTAPWVVLLGENGGDDPEELLRWLRANRGLLLDAG
jgi:hypothetical protein